MESLYLRQLAEMSSSVPFIVMMVMALAAVAVLLYGAWCDVKTHELPDELSIGLVGLWIAKQLLVLWAGIWSGQALVWSLLLSLAVFVAGFVCFILNGVGGGDVKIMSAFSLWIGFEGGVMFLIITLLVGGVMALVLLTSMVVRHGVKSVTSRSRAVPFAYAPAIFVGGLVSVAILGYDVTMGYPL